MRDGVVGDEHHRSRGRHTWILHARNRYSWVWRHWMERMGVVVGCSGVHRLPATSVVSIAATFRSQASIVATYTSPASVQCLDHPTRRLWVRQHRKRRPLHLRLSRRCQPSVS